MRYSVYRILGEFLLKEREFGLIIDRLDIGRGRLLFLNVAQRHGKGGSFGFDVWGCWGVR
jgi:hypothetical protein